MPEAPERLTWESDRAERAQVRRQLSKPIIVARVLRAEVDFANHCTQRLTESSKTPCIPEHARYRHSALRALA